MAENCVKYGLTSLHTYITIHLHTGVHIRDQSSTYFLHWWYLWNHKSWILDIFIVLLSLSFTCSSVLYRTLISFLDWLMLQYFGCCEIISQIPQQWECLSLPPSLSLLRMGGFIRVQPDSGNSAYLRTFTSTAAPAQRADFSITTRHSCIHFLSFQTLVYCQFTEAITAFHSIYKRKTRPSAWVRHLIWQIEMARVWRRFDKDARNFSNEKEHIMSSAASRTSCAGANAFQCCHQTTKWFASLTGLRKNKELLIWTM